MFALAPAAAQASVSSEQSQGAGLLAQVDRGTLKCASLANDQFDAIGEYVMGRMLGSTAAHTQMNTVMGGMVGTRGEQQMHAGMGRRFAGCGGGRMGAAYAGLMGMMGAMGGYGTTGSGSAGVGRGMMGYNAANGSSFGMMGGTTASRSGNGDGWDAATIVIVVLLGVLIALASAALWRQRHVRPGSDAHAGATR